MTPLLESGMLSTSSSKHSQSKGITTSGITSLQLAKQTTMPVMLWISSKGLEGLPDRTPRKGGVELLLQDVVTAATERRPQNGVADLMEPGHCAMLADFVGFFYSHVTGLSLTAMLDYAKLTRKMGSKAPNGPSNLRPKESSPSSP